MLFRIILIKPLKKKINIIVADAQYLIRLGLKCLLNQDDRIEVVAEATNSEELLEMALEFQPEVIIFDYNHRPQFSMDDIEKIKALVKTNFLIISDDNNRANISRVLDFGGSSFLTKTCDKEEIIGAVLAAAKSEKFLCNKVIDIILEKNVKEEEAESCMPACLTEREIEIIEYTAKGLSAKAVADQLFLSTHTIYTHRKNILRKLNMNSSSELIVFALNNGLTKPKTT